MKIILASISNVRKKILQKNNINPEVIVSNIDEDEAKKSLLVEGASPLIVITKQDMKDNGYRNLTEALQSLPIANAATQNESLVNTFTPNANELDLRRFGPGRVLVLVNGRRMADYPFPYNNSSNFVNTCLLYTSPSPRDS